MGDMASLGDGLGAGLEQQASLDGGGGGFNADGGAFGPPPSVVGLGGDTAAADDPSSQGGDTAAADGPVGARVGPFCPKDGVPALDPNVYDPATSPCGPICDCSASFESQPESCFEEDDRCV